MEELQAQLIEEYSQAIEKPTILAILYDFNLANATELSAARFTLDILKSSASAEESTGFDPSGASSFEAIPDDQGSAREESESLSTSQQGSKTQSDDTSISQEPHALDLEGLDLGGSETRESTRKTYSSELDSLDQAGKEEALISMFPALKSFDVKWTLKKCKGDAELAIDELMTQAFLEESGSRYRGIDGFSESEATPRRRKGKGKKNKIGMGMGMGTGSNATSGSSGTPSPVESPVESKWDIGRRDIEFISDKTGIPMEQVASIYHNNGGTTHGTIAAIITAHAAMNFFEDNPGLEINAYELHQELPSIPIKDLEVLLHITNPSVSDARALATALTAPKTVEKKHPIQLDIRHAPFQLDPKPKPKHRALNPCTFSPHDFTNSSEAAATYTTSRNTAFAQASAAYRKGKSNPLMGGAAAYYSSVGRSFDAKAKAAASLAADALAASQSTSLELDLHGMHVKDAVRVSREQVTRWWHECGEERSDGRKSVTVAKGYKIVTGAGNHSARGGKLGPAVAKMLLSEGWRIQVGSGNNMGFLLVLGVVRR